MQTPVQEEIAAVAARWVVEEGMDYGGAKRQAIKALGLPARCALPSNEEVEDAVRAHLALFCADTQPRELAALRRVAVKWMTRLEAFRPHVGGAVWRGTATRHNDVQLQLFCDDSKSAEIRLIDEGVRYDVTTVTGWQGDAVDALTIADVCPELGQPVWVHLMIYDHDAVRGALKPDTKGQTWRGDLKALQQRMAKEEAA